VLGPETFHSPVRFEARVASLLPSAAPLSVELILNAGGTPERAARMEAEGDRYHVTVVPIPPREDQWPFRLAAQFDNGMLDASTTERSFTVGGREVRLSGVHIIRGGPSSQVVLRDGQTIAGALAGLNGVPARLGAQTVSLDLAQAREVTIKSANEIAAIVYTLLVRQGNKEIYRQTQSHSLGVANLLKNPGFEESLEGWSTHVFDARPRIEFDRTVVHEGRQALRIETNALSNTAFGQEVTLKAGQWYRFSGWVRTRALDPHGSPVYGTLQVQTPGGLDIVARGDNHGGDTEWTEVRITFQAPAGGLTRLGVFFVGFGSGTGKAWFDDLNLVEVGRSAN
jgi:Carbohydrate binding domain